MRVDTCVDQTHLGHSCYQGIQGPVESSFSIENSFQLIHIVTQNYVWVEMNSLLKMMIWLVPVSLGNRHRKMTPPVKQQKCRLINFLRTKNAFLQFKVIATVVSAGSVFHDGYSSDLFFISQQNERRNAGPMFAMF